MIGIFHEDLSVIGERAFPDGYIFCNGYGVPVRGDDGYGLNPYPFLLRLHFFCDKELDLSLGLVFLQFVRDHLSD